MNLAVKLDEKYNYADYFSWSADERWEIIEGVPFLISTAPSRLHQEISIAFERNLYDYFEEKNVRYIMLHLMCVLQQRIKK